MPSHAFMRSLVPVILLVAAACSDSSGADVAGPPTKIELASDPMFTATVGSVVSSPLVARVRDDRDRPVAGTSIRFSVQQGTATVSSALVTTDRNGEAATTLTLGTVAGDVAVTATVAGAELSVRFTGIAQPAPAARVVALPKPLRLRAVGDTARLTANLEDQFGNSVASTAISWTSLQPSIATVDAAGLVTARTIGVSTQVVASIASGKADTVPVSVADPNASVCAAAPVSLSVGQAVAMDPATGLCIRASAASEYVAIPYHASNVPGNFSADMRILGANLVPVPTSDVAASVTSSARTSGPVMNHSFEAGLRERERREVGPLAAKSRDARTAREAGAARFSLVPNTLQVGDTITLNASATSACTTPNNRVGRVKAITQKAVVVADTSNPANGFTDADYLRLGRMFDTLVVPVDEQLFGAPGDIDNNNGRSVIFYTRAVNQLSTPGSGSYVGGFFWARDLLDRTVCPTSNAGEIFYMLVPDPTGVYGNQFSRTFVEQVTVGTLAHEYQHLINASVRFRSTTAEPTEVAWLNEGLSHIAEEMVFYRATGLQPRSNIGASQFGSSAFETAYLSYMHSNVGRLRQWLLNPETNTPFGDNDGLATRGAAWAFLRYLADRQPSDGTIWSRLVNNPLAGRANLEDVFKVDMQTQVRNWAIAMYADDYVQGAAADYSFASWGLRSAFPVLPASIRGTYPLTTRPLSNDVGRTFALRGGSAAFFPFAIAAGTDAQVQVSAAVGGSPPAAVSVTVLRVR